MGKKSVTSDMLVLQPTECGRVSFPQVFEAKQAVINGIPSGKPKFSVTLLFPKGSPAVTKLVNLAESVRRATWGDQKFADFKTPFHDGDLKYLEKPETYEAYQGMIAIRFTANEDRPPKIVDQRVQPILDRGDFYAGCYALVATTAWSFDNISKGVSLNLLTLQKVKEGERLAGGSVDPTSVFADIPEAADDPAAYASQQAQTDINSWM